MRINAIKQKLFTLWCFSHVTIYFLQIDMIVDICVYWDLPMIILYNKIKYMTIRFNTKQYNKPNH